MGFQFSLEKLLRLRDSLEHQEEQRLSLASRNVTRILSELTRLDFDFGAAEISWQTAVDDLSLTAALQFRAECAVGYRRVRVKLLAALEEAKQKRLVQLQRYQEARQKREVLARLHARHQVVYEFEAARRQQQLADETYLLRNFLHGDATNFPSD